MHADALLLAKNVDGVYSCDPNANKSAVRYDTLTYKEVVEKELHATDLTAITLCMEQNIPILVFSMKEEGSILRVARGEKVGTIIQ
jgi:uridylate kinase